MSQLTPEQVRRFQSAAQETTEALNGNGDLIDSALTLVSLVNVLLLPPENTATADHEIHLAGPYIAGPHRVADALKCAQGGHTTRVTFRGSGDEVYIVPAARYRELVHDSPAEDAELSRIESSACDR